MKEIDEKIKYYVTKHNIHFVENIYDVPKELYPLIKEGIRRRVMEVGPASLMPYISAFNCAGLDIIMNTDKFIRGYCDYLQGEVFASPMCLNHSALRNDYFYEGEKINFIILNNKYTKYDVLVKTLMGIFKKKEIELVKQFFLLHEIGHIVNDDAANINSNLDLYIKNERRADKFAFGILGLNPEGKLLEKRYKFYRSQLLKNLQGG